MGGIRKARARTAVVLVCIATAFVGTASSAGAAPTARPTRRHIAGYLENVSGNTGASVIFTVPTVTCSDAGAPFQGTAEGVVLFTKTGGFTELAVATGCFGSTPTYTALVNVDGVQTQINKPVVPGDKILVAAGISAADTSGIIRDRAEHWHYTVQIARRAVSEIGVGAIAFGCGTDGCSPAADIAPVRFRSVSIDGEGLANATISKFRAADNSIEVTASRTSSAESAFKVRWVSSCDPGDGTLC